MVDIKSAPYAFKIAEQFVYWGPLNADDLSCIEPLRISHDKTKNEWEVVCKFKRKGEERKATIRINAETGNVIGYEIVKGKFKPIKLEPLSIEDRLEIIEKYTLSLIKSGLTSLEESIGISKKLPDLRSLCRSVVVTGTALTLISIVATWLGYLPLVVGFLGSLLCALISVSFLIAMIRN